MKISFQIVEQSLADAKRGDYLLSWARSSGSRVYFLADAVAYAIRIPFAALRLSYEALVTFYTWGNQGNLRRQTARLDETVSCACLSLFGALASPASAYAFRNARVGDNLLPFASLLLPTRLYYTKPGTGFKPGWIFPIKHLWN